MKRNEIITKLVSEGFNEKTLVNMSDKQIKMLSDRILGEQYLDNKDKTMNIPKEKTDKVRDAEQKRKTFVTYENEEEVGEESELDEEAETTEAARTFANQNRPNMPKGTKFKAGRFSDKKVHQPYEPLNEQDKVTNWVEKLISENYHSMTTKDEIMGVIQKQLNEQEPAVAPPKIKPATRPGREATPEKTPYPDPWQPPDPDGVPDPDPKYEAELPEFLQYDNIMISLNEEKIKGITSVIMEKISKSLKKVK